MTKIIGYAAIKILPDTRDFRDELLDDLRRKLKGGKEKVEVPVEFKADDDQLRREIERARRKAKDLEIELEVKIDPKDWAKEQADARKRAGKLQDDLTKIAAKGEQDRLKEEERARRKRQADAEADARNEAQREKASRGRFAKFVADQESRWKQFRDRQKQNDSKWAESLRKESDRTADRLEANIDRVSDTVADAADKSRKHVERFFEQDFGRGRTIDFLRLDFEQLREDMRRAKDFVERSADTIRGDFDLEIGVEQDMSAFERLRHRLQEIKDDFDNTKLEFGPYVSKSAYLIAKAELMRLARDRLVTLYVWVNKASATAAKRTIESIYSASGLRNAVWGFRKLGDYIKRIDKSAPITAAIASAVNLLSGAAVAAVGSISHLAVEFARMGGAALALPGILGGFAFGVGTMVAALQDFNREVPKVRKDLTMLQDSLSKRFWKEAKVPLLDAWNKVLPHLNRGLDNTAKSLGKWTGAMADAFAEKFDMDAFDHMFDNLSESIDISAKSAGDMAQIFRVLGMTGSEYLPKLAEWANGVAESFANWLTEAQKTGKLNDIIDTGIQKLKEFGKLVREAGEFIGLLGAAAERAGFSGLGEMADGLEEVNEGLKRSRKELDQWMSGAAKVSDGLKSLFGSLTRTAKDFASTFDTIGGDLERALSSIGRTIEDVFSEKKFKAGAISLVDGLANALEHLEGAAPSIGEFLGGISDLAGTVVENVGKVGAAMFDAFGPSIGDILSDLSGPVENLGDAIVTLFDAAVDSGLVDELMDLADVVLSEGIDLLAAAINLLAGALLGLSWITGNDVDFSSIGDNLEDIFDGVDEDLFREQKKLGIPYPDCLLKTPPVIFTTNQHRQGKKRG